MSPPYVSHDAGTSVQTEAPSVAIRARTPNVPARDVPQAPWWWPSTELYWLERQARKQGLAKDRLESWRKIGTCDAQQTMRIHFLRLWFVHGDGYFSKNHVPLVGE